MEVFLLRNAALNETRNSCRNESSRECTSCSIALCNLTL